MLIFLFADTRPSHASVYRTISFMMKQKFGGGGEQTLSLFLFYDAQL